MQCFGKWILLLMILLFFQDLRGSVVKICEFLGKELHEAQTDLVVNNSSFKAMKENKMSNYTLLPQDFLDQTKGSFMRKGKNLI